MKMRQENARRNSRALIGLIGALVLLPAVLGALWSQDFGECTLTGDSDGAPVARTGLCPTTAGTLDLSSRSITSLQNKPFDGMGACTRLFLMMNAISDVPLGTLDSMISLE